jgi:hypothetical protein
MAMKSEPLSLGGVEIHRPGTLIGKALEPLEKARAKSSSSLVCNNQWYLLLIYQL